MGLPYLKFYTADWLADPKVRTLTLEERGFYMDLLCLMWQQKPGYKTSRNLANFARTFGITRAKVERLLAKLQAKLGQSLLVSDEWIESPRLKKEAGRVQDISEKRAESGRQGGRPKKAKAFEDEKPNRSIVEAETKEDKTPQPPRGGAERTICRILGIISTQEVQGPSRKGLEPNQARPATPRCPDARARAGQEV